MTYDPFDRINQGAVDYARERAAGSNTAWRPIWQVLAEGLASGWSCASMIEAATALGLPREVAAPAVEHVLAEANSMAALRGLFAARASGVDVLKA